MVPHIAERSCIALVLLLSVSPVLADAQRHVDDIPICTARGSQTPEAIVSDGAGGAIIAWNDRRSGNADIYVQHVVASRRTDSGWPDDGRALCTAAGEQGGAVMVADGAGGAIVAWHDLRSGDQSGSNDIYAQHVLASGSVDPAWPTDGRALCSGPGEKVRPAMVTDGHGGAIITWSDSRNGNSDVYAQRVLGSGEVDPNWPANGRALCTSSENQYPAAIVTDGAGGAIVVWIDGRNEEDADVYAQRVFSTGVVDPAWPTDGRSIRSAPGEQDNPVMVADEAGGAIVVWTDAHRGPDGYYTGTYDLHAHHVSTTGQLDPAWPQSGLPVCTAADDQQIGGITSDRSGGAIISWLDLRGGRRDIYAQHLLARGVVDPDWPADGLPVCTAPPGDRDAPVIAADGTGGAIIVWDDRRLANYDVYAQHLRKSGTVQPSWPTDGRAVSAAGGSQINVKVAADGAGRVVVAWQDFRSGDADIYARRIHARNLFSIEKSQADDAFELYPPQREPADAGFTVRFVLPSAQPVSVDVFDATGRHVRTVVARQELGVGKHSFMFDGASDAGAPLRHGVYLVRLSGERSFLTRKFAILR